MKRDERLTHLSEHERARMEKLGARIRAAREAKGMTIAELAAAAGVNASFAGELERGRVNPTLRTMIRMADALGCGLGDLADI